MTTALEARVCDYLWRIVGAGVWPSDLPLSAERRSRHCGELDAMRTEFGGTLLDLADAVSLGIAELRKEIAGEDVQADPDERAALERCMEAEIQVWLEIRKKIPPMTGKHSLVSIDGRVRL